MRESLDQAGPAVAAAQLNGRERHLIAVVADLVRELHPQRARFIEVAPLSPLERDLGIDSLGRTELILRIERAFRIRLPAQAIGESETVADLVRTLEQARPSRGAGIAEMPPIPRYALGSVAVERAIHPHACPRRALI
jgi:acyl carrier protein